MQNILNIKLKLETQAKMAYSQANALLREEEEKLRQLFERRMFYERRSQELVEGKLDLMEIKDCRQAVETMKVLIRRQMMQVQLAERKVEAARAQLENVMKERKTQEILRDKAFEEFKQELEHEESKAVDELVSYTYGRKEEQDRR
ncbi:MAG: flagellar export protein FliJ [Lachnospiraceae bacterium]|nr:flagellar export protein FliJ [Lachnospiraceae bacterium]